MPPATEPMSVDELLERLHYAGRSAISHFEPPDVRRFEATVRYLVTTLKDERTERERLQGQLSEAATAFEELDAKYSQLVDTLPVAHAGSPTLAEEAPPPPDTERQPPPTGDGEDVTASVCGLLNVSAELADALRRRSVEGARKYGTVLKTHNGRNAAIDCYQELLDAIVYAHQAALEHEADREAGAPLGPLRDDLISWARALGRRL